MEPHIQVFANIVLAITSFAVNKCWSISRQLWNLPKEREVKKNIYVVSQASRDRTKKTMLYKTVKILYMRRMFAMCRKFVVSLVCFVCNNMWHNFCAKRMVLYHGLHSCTKNLVDHTFSRTKCYGYDSPTKRHSSGALFAFIRLVACLTSCKLQSVL